MVKYRVLTSEELALLEKEYIDFLVVNGITAREWESIKEKQPEKVQTLIRLFSDVIFEKLMRKTKFITQQINEILTCFHYGDDKATMILIENWTIQIPMKEISQTTISSMNLKISKQEKSYTNERELELFNMIQGGAEIADGTLFNLLDKNLSS